MQMEDGTFRDIGRAAGIDDVRDGRGVVTVDLDRDGRMDLVVANLSEKPAIYLNRWPDAGDSIQLRLLRPIGDVDYVGARATMRMRVGDKIRTPVMEVSAGSGYASQSCGLLHFGFPKTAKLLGMTVRWPDGREAQITAATLEGMRGQQWNLRPGRELERQRGVRNED